MFYNEDINLPIWLRYYGNIFGYENLFALDHGSTNDYSGVTGRANHIKLARSPFDDRARAEMIAHFQHALLKLYDYVIYTDCDEIIIPDPSEYTDLQSYLESGRPDYVTCVGLNVVHVPACEPPLDLGRPILGQRSFCRFVSSMCKTLIARVPLRWSPGFHSAGEPVKIDNKLFLFHFKRMDMTEGLNRLRVTRSLQWANPAFGQHQRVSDEIYLRYYDQAGRLPVIDDDLFEFASDLGNLPTTGQYQAPCLRRVPPRFHGIA